MGDIDHHVIENKIAAARTKLILDKPFLGALVLRLELRNASPAWCATTGTDAKKFYYNTEYVESLKPSELQFVLAHEALHCGLSHFARRQHRIKHRWDLACDYAINPMLLDEGLAPPPGVQVLEEYRDMTAEEIYPLLKDNDHSDTMDQHLYDKPDDPQEGGDNSELDDLNQQNTKADNNDHEQCSDQPRKSDAGKTNAEQNTQGEDGQSKQDQNPDLDGPLSAPPPVLSPQEIEDLQEKWQQRTAGAAQQAQQAGKMSAALLRFIDDEIAPTLPWRQLLATYLCATARDDYTYARPNTRRAGSAILPMLKSSQINIVMALDVSGSISDQEMNESISEINAIKGQLRARVTILASDDKIIEDFPKVFEAWEEIVLVDSIKGGGGTDFKPVFDWIATQDSPPDVLVYFTDAQGSFPEHAPNYPVTWLIKGKSVVPWGERIQLN